MSEAIRYLIFILVSLSKWFWGKLLGSRGMTFFLTRPSAFLNNWPFEEARSVNIYCSLDWTYLSCDRPNPCWQWRIQPSITLKSLSWWSSSIRTRDVLCLTAKNHNRFVRRNIEAFTFSLVGGSRLFDTSVPSNNLIGWASNTYC